MSQNDLKSILEHDGPAMDYVEELLRSNDNDNHSKAFALCLFKSVENDGWFRRNLALMYWNGIGTSKDKDVAIQLMNHCDYFRRDYPIVPQFLFKDEVYDYKHVYILGSCKTIPVIYAACAQNNVRISGIITDGSDQIVDLHLPVFDAKDIDKGALIIAFEEIERPMVNNQLLYYNLHPGSTQSVFTINSCADVQSIDSSDLKSGSREDVQKLLARINKKIQDGFPANKISVDYRFFFSIGDYLIHYHKSVKTIHLETVALDVLLGSKIYEKLSDQKQYYIPYHGGLGDQVRVLCKTNVVAREHGVSNPAVIVSPKARDLPRLFGYDGLIMSFPGYRAISQYIRSNQLYDGKVTMWEIRVAYPGIISDHHSLYLHAGESRRSEDVVAANLGIKPFQPYDNICYPDISGFDKYDDAVLLNPYGNYIQGVAKDSLGEFNRFFSDLARSLCSRGIRCFTNSIGPSQPILDGTEVFDGTIFDLISASKHFRAIITIYSGFMELLLMTDVNLFVITPNDMETRRFMASVNNHDNYWEYVLPGRESKQLVDEISENVCNLSKSRNADGVIPAVDFLDKIDYYCDITPEIVQLCNEHPAWRTHLYRRLFDRLDKDELELSKHRLQELANGGDPSALYFESRMYQEGVVVESDFLKAASLMLRAVNAGAKWAISELTSLYLEVKDAPESHDVFIIIEKMANDGDPSACLQISRLYREGIGVSADTIRTIHWLSKAYRLGMTSIRTELFDTIWKYGSSPEEFKFMIDVISEGVQEGDSQSLLRLGRAYRTGRGVGKNLNKAIQYFEDAYKTNPNTSRNELFDALWERGHDEDYHKMLEMMVQGARINDSDSLGRLGRLYSNNKAPMFNLDLALACYSKAADLNSRWCSERDALLRRIEEKTTNHAD